MCFSVHLTATTAGKSHKNGGLFVLFYDLLHLLRLVKATKQQAAVNELILLLFFSSDRKRFRP